MGGFLALGGTRADLKHDMQRRFAVLACGSADPAMAGLEAAESARASGRKKPEPMDFIGPHETMLYRAVNPKSGKSGQRFEA